MKTIRLSWKVSLYGIAQMCVLFLIANFVPSALGEEKITDALILEPIPETVSEAENTETRSILVPTETEKAEKVEKSESENVPPPETEPLASGTQNLIPFHPAATVPAPQMSEKIAGNMPIVANPAAALEAVFQKFQFPYAFIQVSVLHQNAVSRPMGDVTEMELPLVISFNQELYTKFQAEVCALLEQITLSEPYSVEVRFPYRSRNPRKNVFLNVYMTENRYNVYELPESCREVLAKYAALMPVAVLAMYNEQEKVLSQHYFPLLYRDIVKAYPINLMGVYFLDHQTLRIYPHQEEKFSEFIHSQASSFVIPEHFNVVVTTVANQKFLQKNEKNYFLEPSFRREERLPEIPYAVQIQVPTTQFQQIRFMNCVLATDVPGETVVKPSENYEITEEEWNAMNLDVENGTENEPETPATEETKPESILEPSSSSETEGSASSEAVPGAFSKADVKNVTTLEKAIQKAFPEAVSSTLSFYGEQEKNRPLDRKTMTQLAQKFRIAKLEKTETFQEFPTLDLPSVGWLEVTPTLSMMFLYPTDQPENAPTTLTTRAALWLSLEDGTTALIFCDLASDFVGILQETLAK